MPTLRFDKRTFCNALRKKTINPPDIYPPFISVDRQKYNEILTNSSDVDYTPIKKRLDHPLYSQIRSAIGYCIEHEHFFPAYRFMANQCINNEWLAMVDWHKAFHRDHLIHQPMTAYIGLELLNTPHFKLILGKTLIEYCIDAIKNRSGCKYLHDYYKTMGGSDKLFNNSKVSNLRLKWLFLDTFFAAALFHDIGYPWQFMNQIYSRLGSQAPTTSTFIDNVDELIRKTHTRLFMYPFQGYRAPDLTEPYNWDKELKLLFNDSFNNTHGLPGALSFLYFNDELRKYPIANERPIKLFCCEWAAMAILMHDMASIYAVTDADKKITVKNKQFRISLNKDPLSFVLTLADIIQDFERPDATWHKGISGKPMIKYISRCQRVDLQVDSEVNIVNIVYHYKTMKDYLNNQYFFLPKNQRLYFDPDEGYLDYSGTGISQIKLTAKPLH